MNYLDHLQRDWGAWNRFRSKLSIRARGYRLVSMRDVLPAVGSVEELTQAENGALLNLEPRRSLHDLKPPRVALGPDAAYVVDYFQKEFPAREDRPFIAYFRRPFLYGRHFSILDSRGHVFKECIRMEQRWKGGVPKEGRKSESQARHVAGTYLQTCSEFHTHYCHHFTDIVPRLMLYEQQGLLGKIPALLHRDSNKLSDTSFQMLGIDTPEAKRWEDSFWRVDGLYFASEFKKFCSWTPEAAAWMRAKYSPGLDKKSPGRKRFYISRRNAARPALNEDEILAALKPWGLTVIEPDLYPLKEQIEIFSEAGVIVGPHGAGFQNALWAPRGCKVLEFISPRYFTGVYWTLSESVGHQHGIVSGKTAEEGDPIFLGSTYDPALVARAMQQLVGPPL
jgi:hypothetical protein